MGAERQTNTHTYVHKYTHTLFVKQFQETRRAPTAGRRPPGLKMDLESTFQHHVKAKCMKFYILCWLAKYGD